LRSLKTNAMPCRRIVFWHSRASAWNCLRTCCSRRRAGHHVSTDSCYLYGVMPRKF
jgi:hypothetical protein